MIERYNFTDIKDNKTRQEAIDKFCEIIESGNYNAHQTRQVMNNVISCCVETTVEDTK